MSPACKAAVEPMPRAMLAAEFAPGQGGPGDSYARRAIGPDLADAPPLKVAARRIQPRGSGLPRPGPMGRILIRGEPGHDIIPELYPAAGEPVIDKPGKGAFYQTDLELMLHNRGIGTLLVCGVTTEVCVNTTVREANDRGYRCIVLADCCASYFQEFHARCSLKMIMAQGGIFRIGFASIASRLLAAMGQRAA